jgi:REP element-mobilizing transposase RayT
VGAALAANIPGRTNPVGAVLAANIPGRTNLVGAALAANCREIAINNGSTEIHYHGMAYHKSHSRDLRKNRLSEPGRAYLVTTSCQKRATIFSDFNLGSIVADEIRISDQADRTSTYAYVLMPDHLHWLFQLRPRQSLSSVVRRVKGRSSYRVNRSRDSSGAIWETGFHDRAIRVEESLETLGNYVIQNPVRAGLVAVVDDYPLWDLLWQRHGELIRG